MNTKTYHGSCHCGAMRFEADIDFAEGTGKCNCSYCAKTRLWGKHVKPEAFRLLTDEDVLGAYQFNTHSVAHRFCTRCGIHAFTRGDIPEAGGKFVTINVACLDDADVPEMLQGPVRYFDGLHDNWMNPPAETRHL
ncbi:GFA family protein [Fulvimonas sp. R45]|uniref:GFA family protein n=1 Tax=Fulvimonas sp. R45 TaxID=3045937 RepID=UPI00265DD412|nr:GFA family protein [Fulvimonas sp. R45]MDO1529383.1 GFA family protein [Fulvimonas sp. R45]